MPRRPRPVLASLLLAPLVVAATAGCTSRPAQRIAASPTTPRDGWVSFGPRVRLRDDTPPLASVLPPSDPPAWDTAGASGAAGTTGHDEAWSGSAGPYAADGTSGPAYGYGYTPFYAPGGAVPPGLRVPSDDRATSPFSAPFQASFPGADVTAHRPGLSTGSGVYGRQDDEPKPAPRR